MSASSVALSAVALMAGLLIASAIMAIELTAPAPVAQMNRASYAQVAATPVPPLVPRHVAVRSAAREPMPVAQMNRAAYRR
ncbi:MAG: hypothetical protein KDE00_09630 [Rhodobacteraceae bacterium]|nr:hypothetical protein [Paracoccaceae bacterium]